jgi:Predicted neuraminidase (sialidase)
VEVEDLFTEAPFPSCHASTIAESGGALVVAFFAGAREGASDVGVWTCRRQEEAWSEPVRVAVGSVKYRRRHPCWNPVLFQPPEGPLLLFYKVGPTPSRWWGMRIVSADHGLTWSTPERLARGILGPIKNKPVWSPGGALLAPSSCEQSRWRIHIERSEDGGASWHRGRPLNDGRTFFAIQPTLLPHRDGRVQLLCRTRQGVVAECWSEDDGHTWTPLVATHLPNPDSGIDAVVLRDGRCLLVYNHTQVGRSPLNLVVSDDGHDWQAVAVLEDAPGEFSYPAIIEGADGTIHVTWTWNRRRIRRAALDPASLMPVAMEDGHWPEGLTAQRPAG